MNDKSREERLRRMGRELGYRVLKKRSQPGGHRDAEGFMLVERERRILGGKGYRWSLDDLETYLRAARVRHSASLFEDDLSAAIASLPDGRDTISFGWRIGAPAGLIMRRGRGRRAAIRVLLREGYKSPPSAWESLELMLKGRGWRPETLHEDEQVMVRDWPADPDPSASIVGELRAMYAMAVPRTRPEAVSRIELHIDRLLDTEGHACLFWTAPIPAAILGVIVGSISVDGADPIRGLVFGLIAGWLVCLAISELLKRVRLLRPVAEPVFKVAVFLLPFLLAVGATSGGAAGD